MTRDGLIAHPDIKFDELLGHVEFRSNVPVDKIIPGEETFAEKHVGAWFVSKTKGPIFVMYSSNEDIFMILNGHHRWAEAKARGDRTIEAWVSVLNEERGFGSMTHKEFIRDALKRGEDVPERVLRDYPNLRSQIVPVHPAEETKRYVVKYLFKKTGFTKTIARKPLYL